MIRAGEWRWIRPDAGLDPDEYLARDWVPGVLVSAEADAAGTLELEAIDGRRGRVEAGRVGESCRDHEFLPATWQAMQRRSAEIASTRKGGACSK